MLKFHKCLSVGGKLWNQLNNFSVRDKKLEEVTPKTTRVKSDAKEKVLDNNDFIVESKSNIAANNTNNGLTGELGEKDVEFIPVHTILPMNMPTDDADYLQNKALVSSLDAIGISSGPSAEKSEPELKDDRNVSVFSSTIQSSDSDASDPENQFPEDDACLVSSPGNSSLLSELDLSMVNVPNDAEECYQQQDFASSPCLSGNSSIDGDDGKLVSADDNISVNEHGISTANVSLIFQNVRSRSRESVSQPNTPLPDDDLREDNFANITVLQKMNQSCLHFYRFVKIEICKNY